MIIIGIDPGASGAAVLYQDGTVLGIMRFKDMLPADIANKLSRWELKWDVQCAYIEQVSAMPTDAKHNAFQFGFNTGMLHGMMAMLSIPVFTVAPQSWQRHCGLGKKFATKNGRKNAHKELAAKKHPRIKMTLDLCDAMLIAEYGWARETGNADVTYQEETRGNEYGRLATGPAWQS